MKKVLPILLLLLIWGCAKDSGTEKHQGKRDNVVKVRDKVKEVTFGDLLIGRIARSYIFEDYLIITDYETLDELIHVFRKDDFSHVTSFAFRGQGPGEIANLGQLSFNEDTREIYVNDHGKQKIFAYPLDSILANPHYMPVAKMEMDPGKFPDKLFYVNDTVSIGRLILPTGNSGFNQRVAKFNLKTGAVTPMKYTHPEIKKVRDFVAVSKKYGIYVECYNYHDLMTICTLDGDLLYNIYGPKWSNLNNRDHLFYEDVLFCGDKILATCGLGKTAFTKTPPIKAFYPDAILVFDLEGNYQKTIEVGYNIVKMVYDEKNHRLFLTCEDEIQFAALDLKGLV